MAVTGETQIHAQRGEIVALREQIQSTRQTQS